MAVTDCCILTSGIFLKLRISLTRCSIVHYFFTRLPSMIFHPLAHNFEHPKFSLSLVQPHRIPRHTHCDHSCSVERRQ